MCLLFTGLLWWAPLPVALPSFLVSNLAAQPLEVSVPSASPAPSVRIQVLSRYRLEQLKLSGPAAYHLVWKAPHLFMEGQPVALPLRLPSARWTVQLPGGLTRTYVGALELHAPDGTLRLILNTQLESYVAQVVRAESDPKTPPATLEALAVVVRSFALARRGAHEGSNLCDLAHCQVFQGLRDSADATRARRATTRTRGWRLVLADGRPALPLFHAACGGQTLDPTELYEGADLSGAASVGDSGCAPQPWQLRLTRKALADGLAQLFWPGGQAGVPGPEHIRLDTGVGGVLRWVQDLRSGERRRGEKLFRLLGESQGWDRLRSPRFTWERQGELYLIRGQGLGHGVGLCQLGARRRALEGASAEAILQHYFPHARLFKE